MRVDITEKRLNVFGGDLGVPISPHNFQYGGGHNSVLLGLSIFGRFRRSGQVGEGGSSLCILIINVQRPGHI